MTEQWLVFKDRETGRELCAYTIRGTFPGERNATIEQLAHDNGMDPERITATLERRRSGGKPTGSDPGRDHPRDRTGAARFDLAAPWTGRRDPDEKRITRRRRAAGKDRAPQRCGSCAPVRGVNFLKSEAGRQINPAHHVLSVRKWEGGRARTRVL